MIEEEKRTKAWIGDAVLALFAREWILHAPQIKKEDRADAFIRMTSNKFLSAVGEPTAMEAEIGVIYERNGLQAAFDHIEGKYVPLFKKQLAKRRQPGSYRKKGSLIYVNLTDI
jgi:dsRNA-specific ribonuclease